MSRPSLLLRNPRTGEPDGTIATTQDTDLRTLASRLRVAQPRWESLGPLKRGEVLQQWKQAMLSRRAEIENALIADTGRKRESIMEFDAMCGTLDRWARLAPELMEEKRFTSTMGFIDVARNLRAYQLVGIISPWNFPLVLSTIDLFPALMAGSAVILKPSEVTPRFAEPLLASVRDVPELAAVFGVAIGDGSVGGNLVSERIIDLVCFTGSVPTGRKVAAMAAASFIPAFLELGGKDGSIVCAGADLDLAASALLWGSTSNAGQACQSMERIYVQRAAHNEFVVKLAERAARLSLAYPSLDDPGLGPIIAERQVPVLEAHLRDAIAKGAVVVTGSTEVERHGGGAWVRATVLTNVSHDMLIMTEETFGPFLPVMAFDTIDEAVALVNDSRFGLSAAVFAATNDEAEAIGRRLDAGAISINDSTLTALLWEGEKHSFKDSGLGGSRMGSASLFRFLRSQALLIKTKPIADPWWWPGI